CNRITRKYTHLTPSITININTDENFVEVIDEGDGMSKEIIKNHFSVIGKSISQEFNDSTGNFNLISQFGIGFISTFIVAEKVLINTKNESDVQVSFEIEDVFKGFKYQSVPDQVIDKKSGTSIRVYLKRDYSSEKAFKNVMTYCRHISNLQCYLNGSKISLPDSWNIENSIYTHFDRNERYEVKLGISPASRPIYASNSGFLITNNSAAIIPYKFPYIIHGEVNFQPKGIDFDVSRSNIIVSEKSNSFRRDISVVLRRFFRQALESRDPRLSPIIINHLHHYLQYYDADRQKMEESYSDFYSKKELIALCNDMTILPYMGGKSSLTQILVKLKQLGINTVYYSQKTNVTDYEAIVIKYLETKGNLIFVNRSFNVPFRDISQPTNIYSVLQIIANENAITVEDIAKINPYILEDMKMKKSSFDEKLLKHLSVIEEEYQISIEIGKFSKTTKPSAVNGNQIFLNFDHHTFQSMIEKLHQIPDEVLKIYLLGLLGLQLKG
ncbi:MAG TPA: ATP-binding protein, partial [Sphingobacteriaceae bacterium]